MLKKNSQVNPIDMLTTVTSQSH